MANIPPLVSPPAERPMHSLGWVTFNLLFVLAISGIVNLALIFRLATIR